MIFDPIRQFRRRRRLHREALEEAALLRRRHGEDALTVARRKLAEDNLTAWGRRVIAETVRLLEEEPEAIPPTALGAIGET